MKKLFTAILIFYISKTVQAQNVGIGTTTPTEKLQVVGGIRTDSLSFGSSSSVNFKLNKINSGSIILSMAQFANFATGINAMIYQSFMVNNSVVLKYASLKCATGYGSFGQLKLYQGLGVGGSLLATTYMPAAPYNHNEYNNSGVIDYTLMPNQVYTLAVDNGASWMYSSTGDYISGVSSLGNNIDMGIQLITYTTSNIVESKSNNAAILNMPQPNSAIMLNGFLQASNLRLTDGAGANKVLVSDESGNASWQTTNKMISGNLPIGGNAGNGRTKTMPLSFGATFAAPPKVFANARTEAGQTINDGFSVTIRSVNTTSCILIITRTDDSAAWLQNLSVDWMAIQ